MSSSPTRVRSGNVTTRLKLGQFHGLKEELSQWRVDPHIQELERERRGGIILGFVKGLRLSARLIYAIRDCLSTFDLEVDWGHLLTEEGNSCSPECDIVIHSRGYEDRWNGRKDSIMDFKFINCQNAIGVISCKSLIKSVDRRYCERIKPYVKNVLLFAECCEPNMVERLRKSAKSAGYKGFWYLYAYNQDTSVCTADEEVWIDFLETIRCLARGL